MPSILIDHQVGWFSINDIDQITILLQLANQVHVGIPPAPGFKLEEVDIQKDQTVFLWLVSHRGQEIWAPENEEALRIGFTRILAKAESHDSQIKGIWYIKSEMLSYALALSKHHEWCQK